MKSIRACAIGAIVLFLPVVLWWVFSQGAGPERATSARGANSNDSVAPAPDGVISADWFAQSLSASLVPLDDGRIGVSIGNRSGEEIVIVTDNRLAIMGTFEVAESGKLKTEKTFGLAMEVPLAMVVLKPGHLSEPATFSLDLGIVQLGNVAKGSVRIQCGKCSSFFSATSLDGALSKTVAVELPVKCAK